jgi:prepilin peptidase CpaA
MKFALLLVLATAVAYDLRERRIPNYLILAGLAAALAFSIPGGIVDGIGRFLAGVLLGMALFLPFFAARLLGAGDVKLLGVVGGFIGWEAVLMVWFYTLMAGGVLGLASLLVQRTAPQFFRNLKLVLISMTCRVEGVGLSLKEMASQTSASVPYAVAIAAGALIWMVRQS